MINILLLFVVAIFALNIQLNAQNQKLLPNHGLTHKITPEEKFLMSCRSKSIFATNPPVGPVRNIAEFEPSEAVIIAYKNGFGLPYSLINDISNAGKLIIVATSSNQSTITSLLNSNGVNTANCSFLTVTGVDSWWTRDYTGWFIADSSHRVQIVDFVYNRPRPYDDIVPSKQAQFLGITMYGMDIEHTGGNYMCDGYNNAISTSLVLSENPSLSQTQVQQTMQSFLGINNYMIRPDAQGAY